MYDDVGEGVFRMLPPIERDGSNVVMIQQNYENQDTTAATPASTRPGHSWSTSFPLPLGIFEDLPSVSESNATGSHPLLMAQGTLDSANGRLPRLRHRRYQYLQWANPRSPNPPVILQRLLVPAAQTLPLAASHVLASSFRDTRVVVMDNTLGILANQEEEQIDFVDQSGYLFGPSLAATLNNIPTALHWWIEESKLLDGDSQPDCCVGVVHKLIPGLEKRRNAELAERKEKRKKQHGSETKEGEKEAKEAKETAPKSGESTTLTLIPAEQTTQQRASAAECILHTERFFTAVEAAFESVRQESRDENIIEVTGEMEVTVQDDEERSSTPQPPPPPPPPPPPQESSVLEVRDPRLASRSTTVELAESLIDSVLLPGAEEATRLRIVGNHDAELADMSVFASSPLPTLADLPSDQEVPNPASHPGNSTPWVQRLISDENERFERNANIVTQETPTSSTSVSGNLITEQPAQSEAPQAQLPIAIAGPPSQAIQVTSQPATATQAPSIQDNVQLPDGVDPSFLAALPEEMRDEVIAEHLRLQRIRTRPQQAAVEEVTGPVEVNAEFLAALPPSIQEEVLAQQRLEQQRHAAASANPEDPVDAAAFFQNLQPSLRQAILTDMEESQISVLPPDLAQEAQNLRREWEARNRHLMQERFLNHVSQGNSALSNILRHTGRGRGGGTRYSIHSVPQRAQWHSWNPRGEPSIAHQSAGLRLRGRQLLDHESMACLLVLLFVDEPKINTLRLHRVVRNLCYHGSTREWVVKSLLNIMERSNEENKEILIDYPGKNKRKVSPEYVTPKVQEMKNTLQSWLNVSIDAALGCRANVFHIVRHSGKKSERLSNMIAIHPQAAPTVCRHTLELLISLAKSFPGYFVPTKTKESEDKSKEEQKTASSASKEETGAKPKSVTKSSKSELPDFWDMLLKLDSCASKKGKSVTRTHSSSALGTETEQGQTSFDASAFGQLISMLHWSVVRRSSQLTDKLLRLLSLISIGLTEVNSYRRQDSSKNKKTEPSKEQSVAAPESHLRLAVQVLTSKSCSEEGLEDATALLLNLSHCPDPTRQLILKLLLEGAMELANMVCEHINELMMELQILNREFRRRNSIDDQPSTSSGGSGRGTLMDRFTLESVIVTAPSKVKAGTDLQLPSMSALVSKTSSQAFFLRILKVIVQIREAVRLANKKKTETTNTTTTTPAAAAATAASVAPVVAAPAAAATTTAASAAPVAPSTASTPQPTTTSSATVTGTAMETALPSEVQKSPENDDNTSTDNLAMDTAQATSGQSESPFSPLSGAQFSPATEAQSSPDAILSPETTFSRSEEENSSLPLLSESLVLDNLWETLSACLLELEHTPDHHAVLVLQPAVEAFFLVHSSSSTASRGRNNENNTETREVAPDMAPASPTYSESEGTSQPEAESNPWDIAPTPQKALPSDQLKFLKFAGNQ